MPELTALQGKTECINIPQKISTNWRVVGTLLLDDKAGTIVPAIAREYRDNATEINSEILARWVQGRGIADTSWRGLLGVLNKCCPALAESIEEALSTEENKVSESGKCLYIYLRTHYKHHPLTLTHTPLMCTFIRNRISTVLQLI